MSSSPEGGSSRGALGFGLVSIPIQLFTAVREREDGCASALVPDQVFGDEVAAATERYRDDRWTWRR